MYGTAVGAAGSDGDEGTCRIAVSVALSVVVAAPAGDVVVGANRASMSAADVKVDERVRGIVQSGIAAVFLASQGLVREQSTGVVRVGADLRKLLVSRTGDLELIFVVVAPTGHE